MIEMAREFPAAAVLLVLFGAGMLYAILKLLLDLRRDKPETTPLGKAAERALTDAPSLVLGMLTGAIIVLLVSKMSIPEQLWGGWLLVLGYFTGTHGRRTSPGDITPKKV